MGLERHVVLVRMMAPGKATRGRVPADSHNLAYNGTGMPPGDPRLATELVAHAARLGAPDARWAE